MNYIQIIKTAERRIDKLAKAQELLSLYLKDWDGKIAERKGEPNSFYYATKHELEVLTKFVSFSKAGKGGVVPLDSREDYSFIQDIYRAKELSYGGHKHKF